MRFDVGSVYEINHIYFHSSQILARKLKHSPFFLLVNSSITKSLSEFL